MVWFHQGLRAKEFAKFGRQCLKMRAVVEEEIVQSCGDSGSSEFHASIQQYCRQIIQHGYWTIRSAQCAPADDMFHCWVLGHVRTHGPRTCEAVEACITAIAGSFAEVLDNYFTLPDKPSDLAELKAGL